VYLVSWNRIGTDPLLLDGDVGVPRARAIGAALERVAVPVLALRGGRAEPLASGALYLLGTSLLVAPSAIQQGWNGPSLKGFLLLQFGCCGWAFGSILQRRHVTKAHPVVSGSIQQLATGLVFLGPAWLSKTQPVHWTPRSTAAVLYLVTFGSVIGYSAYLYALDKLPVSVVSTYNYINPVVAILLGWLFYREQIGIRELLAMLIIFTGVALVKRYGRRSTT